MWQARFYQSLPKIVAEYPDARWLFLTPPNDAHRCGGLFFDR
jgi:hypothetical protein